MALGSRLRHRGCRALLSRGARWSWASTRAVYGGGWQSDRLSLCASRRWPQPRVQEDLDTHPQEAGPRRPRGGGRAARARPARGSQFVFQALRLRHPQAHGPVSLSARRPPQGTLPRPGGHSATCASTSRLSPEPPHPPARGQHRAGMGFGSTAGGRCPPGCPAGGQRLPVANKCPVVPPVLLVSVISWGPPTSQICSQGRCRELPGLLPRAGLGEGPVGLRGSTKCQALRSGSVAPRVSWALRESGSPWAAESRKGAQGCLGAAGARPVLRGRRQAGGLALHPNTRSPQALCRAPAAGPLSSPASPALAPLPPVPQATPPCGPTWPYSEKGEVAELTG